MSIFDYAMQLEQEGKTLYDGFAESAPQKKLKGIFRELAEQEERHYQIFKKMKEDQDATLEGTSFLNNVKSVFSEWKQNKAKFNFDMSQVDLYRKALEIEQKSKEFYQEKAKEVPDGKQKEIFLKIAHEEQAHYDVIANIVDFLEKPERWVEHAEFSKIGEEY